MADIDILKELQNLKDRVEALEAKNKRFTPPKIQEVQEYCTLRNNSIDPDNFISFYKSKGWKVGNTKMKDWKAAIRTWEKRNEKGGGSGGSGGDEGASRLIASCEKDLSL